MSLYSKGLSPVPDDVVPAHKYQNARGAWRVAMERNEELESEIARLRARVAELEAAASPDDAHTTTETRTEWREVLINDEQFLWSIPASGVAMARKHPAYRVESRTVSTTTRTTDWKADER